MKNDDIHMSTKAMKDYEEAIHVANQIATRSLLISRNAEDLLPMLGLEKDPTQTEEEYHGA